MSYYRKNTQSEFISSRRGRQWQRNQNTVAFAPKVAMGPITHTILIALLIAVLGLIYLSQVTKTSSYGYILQDQNNQVAFLNNEKKSLEIENARLQALTKVKDSSVAKAMTAPTSTDYAGN